MRRALLALALALAACREDAAPLPAPVALTAEAVGHYCQMNLLEHPGPKAQVHLKGLPAPLFFSQVRDAIAYQRMPEQSDTIAAIYVNDMGAAPGGWDDPGADNWIAADGAFYVVGSARAGGMGAPETVPFAAEAAARGFATENGGEVLRLADIPNDAVLAPAGPDSRSAGDEGDYAARLRALSPETKP